ncbi:hypothetical protein CBM2634_A10164 [Cupriavidus taiwanensis]|uniref:Uncharacterized protein n=1 Tax=Cupriavidus taiwanensis TaxID=164546 RepID=A0A375IVA7_9BURK|nr:hypothetical protein CBM2634_A10164 [Cupriavidus taiwanensis]
MAAPRSTRACTGPAAAEPMPHCMETGWSSPLYRPVAAMTGLADKVRTFSQRITKIYNGYANLNISSDHPTNNNAEKLPCQSFLILLRRCACWP